MNNYTSMKPSELNMNVFSALLEDWMAVCAKDGEETNAMTASWGGFGILWNKPVAYVFIRPQRYTKKLVDASERLTLNFFSGKEKEALGYLGKVTAAEVPDKMAQCGLKQVLMDDVFYFEEADIVVVAKKLYQQTMMPDCFLDHELIAKNYPNEDFHDVYVCEVEQVLVKQVD